MSIAASVERRLNEMGVKYEMIPHRHTSSSTYTAQAAHVPGEQLAKSVMLEDDRGFVMAVLPAARKVDLRSLRHLLGRNLGLANESEFAQLFADCEPGAIPPLGDAYGVDTIVDNSLVGKQDIYFESGDHCAVVHVSGDDFLKLMGDAPRDTISDGRH
jgi:Ala-tRNA(Pro) deacylase